MESCLILTKEHGHLSSALQIHIRNLSFLAWSTLSKSMADNEYKALGLLPPPFSCMLLVRKITFIVFLINKMKQIDMLSDLMMEY